MAPLHEDTTAKDQPQLSAAGARLGYQAHAHGGLSRTTIAKLDQIGRGKTKTTPALPSTRLVREWGGKAHVVTIGEDKVICWDNRQWNSLSEIAREITVRR